MFLKDFKKLISKLSKFTIVKIGSQEPKLTISVDQDGQWYLTILPQDNSSNDNSNNKVN